MSTEALRRTRRPIGGFALQASRCRARAGPGRSSPHTVGARWTVNRMALAGSGRRVADLRVADEARQYRAGPRHRRSSDACGREVRCVPQVATDRRARRQRAVRPTGCAANMLVEAAGVLVDHEDVAVASRPRSVGLGRDRVARTWSRLVVVLEHDRRPASSLPRSPGCTGCRSPPTAYELEVRVEVGCRGRGPSISVAEPAALGRASDPLLRHCVAAEIRPSVAGPEEVEPGSTVARSRTLAGRPLPCDRSAIATRPGSGTVRYMPAAAEGSAPSTRDRAPRGASARSCHARSPAGSLMRRGPVPRCLLPVGP